MQHNLTQLAAQGQRTGAGIQAGALAGASGLRVLGIAGLGAFAAVTALDKVMRTTGENANRVFSAGVGAAAAGTPIARFTQISQALNKAEVVPEADTQSFLQRVRQFQTQAGLGNFDQNFAKSLQQIVGADINPLQDTPEQMTAKIARAFSGISPDLATTLGENVGMTSTLAQGLGRVGGRFTGLVNAQAGEAYTEADKAAAAERLKSTNSLGTALERLYTTISTELTPTLVSINSFLTKIITFFNRNADARGAVGDAAIMAVSPPYGLYRMAQRFFGGGAATRGGAAGSAAPGPGAAASGDFFNSIPGQAILNSGENPGGRNLPSNSGTTASGRWRITDGTWRDNMRAVPGAEKYQTALDAPLDIQDKVAAEIYRKRGFQPWVAMTPDKIAAANAAMAAGGGSLAHFATGNAVPGGASPVTGIHPEYAARIAAMAEAMPPNIRAKFNITSGFRDARRQAQVNPGVTNSRHSLGMAADTTWDPEVRAWITEKGGKFGVGFPLAADPKEGNHMEPLEGGQRIANPVAWSLKQHLAIARAQAASNNQSSNAVTNNHGDMNGDIHVHPPSGDPETIGQHVLRAFKSYVTPTIATQANGQDH